MNATRPRRLPTTPTMSPLKCAAAVVIGVLLLHVTQSAGRGTLAARNDAAPKGCKWQRLTAADAAGAGAGAGAIATGNGGGLSAAASAATATATSTIAAAGAAADHSMRHLLTCKLRTLSSIDALIGNLSVYQTDRISRLHLECSDVLFFESSLAADQHGGAFLGSLRNLRQLTVEYCKIRNVPSMVLRELRELRALSVRTHNADWNVMTMELHPESFRGLTELQELDLGANNVWSVPTEVFCPLFALKRLNLTRNHLSDVAQLGFADWRTATQTLGKACNTGLETLDLSHNQVQKLPDNGLSALGALGALLLQENQLTVVVDRAFAGLQSLSVLNMSSNRLVALPPDLLRPTRQLQQLYLQNNTLAMLAPGLLHGLDRLEVLDVSQNRLGAAWINRSTFDGLIRLVVLNLGYNQLVNIDQGIFRGLYSLQILNLEQNAIDSIASNAFADLKNLHALTLSNNRLKSLDTFHLSELYVLNQLFLDGNVISTIAERVFENLTNLNDLSLNDNRLTNIPRGIRKLQFLKSLDLGKNRIESIARNSFDGLEHLLGLRLVDNQLANISRDTFHALSSVHVINLASNRIRHIDQSAFSANPTLRAIRLDHNQLEDISGVFTALPNLVWLNVSDNQLRWFDYSHLPASLEWLDMHRNNLTELGNYFEQRNQLQIKMLDVSYNRLQRIDEASIPDTIETLFVNNNVLAEVAVGTFLRKRNIEKVVLYGNALRTLDIGAFALQPVTETRDMPVFYLGDNPIHCDCHMEWLQRINELAHLRQHPRVLDLDLVQCTLEHERGEVQRPLMDLQSADFLCRYESHCFALCHCCDFDACDCKMQCPDRCSCYHDHTWNTNVVDCGQAEYTEVPERIPMDATAIYLDGNNLGHLGSHAFIGKKRLEQLYLNSSHVQSVHNKTFNGVPALKRLHLEHNQLAELRDSEFEQLGRLTELHLQGNEIRRIGARTFAPLTVLEVLRLGDNHIENFDPWQQFGGAIVSGSLMHLAMNGVRWRCECGILNRLAHWMRGLNDGEFEVQRMVCSDDRVLGDAMHECARTATTRVLKKADGVSGVTETMLDGRAGVGGGLGAGNRSVEQLAAAAAGSQAAVDSSQLVAPEYVPLVAGAAVVLLVLAFLLLIACAFRQPIRLWLHSRYGLRLFNDPTTVRLSGEDNEKLYDAYVVYSIRDDNYASQIIAPELHGYSVCLHHRDIPATSYLNDALQSAADASKKLLIVVSMNFLQHEWSQPQFRLALQKCIENIAPPARSRRLVLVLTAPIEIIAIDPIMQVLMQTCPVVSWGEKRFWDKLRYALPDVQQRGGVGGKKGGPAVTVTCNPGLRYTPAPINLDVWSKAQQQQQQQQQMQQLQRPGLHIPMTERHSLRQQTSPTAAAAAAAAAATTSMGGGGVQLQPQHLDEDASSCASSQHYAVAPVPSYMCRSSASSLGHVYSTIPEQPTSHPAGGAGNDRPEGPAYFV